MSCTVVKHIFFHPIVKLLSVFGLHHIDKVHDYHTAEFFDGFNRLVNRNDDVVDLVLINGKTAWQDGSFSENFGDERFGDFLEGKHN